MNLLRSIGLFLIVVLAVGNAPPAHSYLFFFGEDLNSSEGVPLGTFPNASSAEADFLAVLAGTGTEDFEGFATGTAGPLNLTFPGAGNATLQGGDGVIATVGAGLTNGLGRYGTSPQNYWEVAAGGTGDFEIAFSEDVAAFGFFGVDIGDFGGDLSLEASLVGGATETFDVDHTIGAAASTGGSVIFWGVIAEAGDALFQSVAFLTDSGDDDVFAFDDFTIGVPEQVEPPPNPIPEPTTALLLGIGLCGLGARARRPRL